MPPRPAKTLICPSLAREPYPGRIARPKPVVCTKWNLDVGALSPKPKAICSRPLDMRNVRPQHGRFPIYVFFIVVPVRLDYVEPQCVRRLLCPRRTIPS